MEGDSRMRTRCVLLRFNPQEQLGH
eukprot:COSAG06_NODE_63659_length_261_cov_1.956790_1_plen_24_part_01